MPIGGHRTFLIVHADDAGLCHSVNLATIEVLEAGVAQSCSVMVPCGAAREFAAYARSHPQFDYGIHLTVNAEWAAFRWGPVACPRNVPSLVDDDGFLHRSVEAFRRNAVASEVRVELRAQIERAQELGIPFSHFDTHMGALLCRWDLIQEYVTLGAEYRVPILLTREACASALRADRRRAARFPEELATLAQAGVPNIDRVISVAPADTLESQRQRYFDIIAQAKGVNQLIIHAGHDDLELHAITCRARARDWDRLIFTGAQIVEAIRAQHIQLGCWKDLALRRE